MVPNLKIGTRLMLLCPMPRLKSWRPPTSGTHDARDSLIMDPGCKEAGMVSGKECDGFREDGAVEEAGENDT